MCFTHMYWLCEEIVPQQGTVKEEEISSEFFGFDSYRFKEAAIAPLDCGAFPLENEHCLVFIHFTSPKAFSLLLVVPTSGVMP